MKLHVDNFLCQCYYDDKESCHFYLANKKDEEE